MRLWVCGFRIDESTAVRGMMWRDCPRPDCSEVACRCGRLGRPLDPAQRSFEAENLVLRRRFALFKERSIKPWRIDAATRAGPA